MRSTFRSLVFQSRCLTTNFNRLLVPRQGPILRHFRGSAAASGHNSSRRVPINIPPSEERTHFRSWSNYAVPAVLLVITGAGLLIHYNDERRAVVKGSNKSKEGLETRILTKPAIGGPFSLIDSEYRSVTEQDLKGNWNVMYFGYTSSPDVCPDEIEKMAVAVQILDKEHNLKVVPIFITIDPPRDGPSHLHAYLKEFNPRILGLTGPVSAIRHMAQEYRVFFKKLDEDGQDYLVDLSHNMYLLNPNMEFVRCFGPEYHSQELAEEILKEVKGAK
ncbi:protein SCO1 homolog 2, mitochondrial [Nymphaea colorata]|nr:protein SCO1 homolog 2, mitochondrial [Nymphaea colorata]